MPGKMVYAKIHIKIMCPKSKMSLGQDGVRKNTHQDTQCVLNLKCHTLRVVIKFKFSEQLN